MVGRTPTYPTTSSAQDGDTKPATENIPWLAGGRVRNRRLCGGDAGDTCARLAGQIVHSVQCRRKGGCFS